jgi:hypothetical protein
MKTIMSLCCVTALLAFAFTPSMAAPMNGPAGSGTSDGSQAVGGPGHGPEGAMNGTPVDQPPTNSPTGNPPASGH